MTVRASVQRDSAGGADTRGTAGASRVDDRESWIDCCADRLAALAVAPATATDAGFEHWRALAAEMWEEVGLFDPVIAAEMEFEANQLDD